MKYGNFPRIQIYRGFHYRKWHLADTLSNADTLNKLGKAASYHLMGWKYRLILYSFSSFGRNWSLQYSFEAEN